MTIDTDPVGMGLSTRCALDFESVVVGILCCVSRPEVSDTGLISNLPRPARIEFTR